MTQKHTEFTKKTENQRNSFKANIFIIILWFLFILLLGYIWIGLGFIAYVLFVWFIETLFHMLILLVCAITVATESAIKNNNHIIL